MKIYVKSMREGKRKNGAQFAWDEDRITGLNSDTDPELWREVYSMQITGKKC
jgi:hypothetical protein